MKNKRIKILISIYLLALISIVIVIYSKDNLDSNNKELENQSSIEVDVTKKGSNEFTRIAITFYGDSTTQMGVSWYTENKDGFGNDIQIVSKDNLQHVDVDYQVQFGVNHYDEKSMYHQAEISGLLEGRTYYFRVGDEKTDKWSDYGSFATNNSKLDKFSFTAITDTQNEHLPDAYYAAATMEMALEQIEDSAFILHSGDFVDDGGDELLWSAMMNASKKILMNNIIAPAVGNHEEDNNAFWQHFMLEKTNGHKTTGIYYSFDYGNAHFVVLDTNKKNDEKSSYIDDEQLKWLKDDLKKAKDSGAKWIIVNMHKGTYTVGKHADNDKFQGEEGARLRLGNVFEEYGVDLVIQGHDHIPSVTKPIKDGEVSDNGVVYMNTGAAGMKTYTFKENMDKEYYKMFDYYALKDRKNNVYQNFAKVSIDGDALKVTMYESNLLSVSNTFYTLYEFEILK